MPIESPWRRWLPGKALTDLCGPAVGSLAYSASSAFLDNFVTAAGLCPARR